MVARLNANFALDPLRIVGSFPEKPMEMEWMAHGAIEEIQKMEYYKTLNDSLHQVELVIGTGMKHSKNRGKFLPLRKLNRFVTKYNRKWALVFGREETGLNLLEIGACDRMIDFYLPGEQQSMNLALSVSYALGALYNQELPEKTQSQKQNEINHIDFFAYSKTIFELLEMHEFHGNPNLALKTWKEIIRKANLNQGELNYLFSFFRNIQDSLQRNRK